MTTRQEQQEQQRGFDSNNPIDLTTTRPTRVTGYDVDLEDESLYSTRKPTSARRYRTDDPNSQAVSRPHQQSIKKRDKYDEVKITVRRKSRQPETTRPQAQTTTHKRERRTEPVLAREEEEEEPRTEPARTPRQRAHAPRFHWLLWVGIGMLALLVLWIVGALLLSWWNTYQDDLHYGRPRTYQTDARVGHNDVYTPSHFIAINLHRQVEVIEFPGGDATHAKVYLVPSMLQEGNDLTVVTLAFKDLTHNGKLDMIITVGNDKFVFINANGAFRPVEPGDNITSL